MTAKFRNYFSQISIWIVSKIVFKSISINFSWVLFLLLGGLALLFSLLALTSHKWYYVRFGKRVMLLLYYLFAHNKRELFYENLLNMP
ncbi:hypothetical protein CGSSp11BS70_10110 [Streptococcus pneumoniae SP11-BS70]|nr:hypothetical protein CGSSp11BS70_10110 [Streptococcus pneumoniae SP11-BS70]